MGAVDDETRESIRARAQVAHDGGFLPAIRGGLWLALLADLDAALAEAERRKWAPLGDNHHNAAACPHCSPASIIAEQTARAGRAEADRDALLAKIARAEARCESFERVGRDLVVSTARQIRAALTEEG